jgi:hypothetical protein
MFNENLTFLLKISQRALIEKKVYQVSRKSGYIALSVSRHLRTGRPGLFIATKRHKMRRNPGEITPMGRCLAIPRGRRFAFLVPAFAGIRAGRFQRFIATKRGKNKHKMRKKTKK